MYKLSAKVDFSAQHFWELPKIELSMWALCVYIDERVIQPQADPDRGSGTTGSGALSPGHPVT